MVINLRNSSQPDDTETVEVRALIRISVAHFSSARSPEIVPTAAIYIIHCLCIYMICVCVCVHATVHVYIYLYNS